jgi:hypothetical protein
VDPFLKDRIEDRGPGTKELALRGARDWWWLSQFPPAERGLLLLWARRGRRCERRDCVWICHADHRGRPYPRLKPWAQKRLERLRQKAWPDGRSRAWPLAEEALRIAQRAADHLVGKVAQTARYSSEGVAELTSPGFSGPSVHKVNAAAHRFSGMAGLGARPFTCKCGSTSWVRGGACWKCRESEVDFSEGLDGLRRSEGRGGFEEAA